MVFKHKLTKLHEGIFLLEMDDTYDLAMTFCRAQEYYESPFNGIRGKMFTISKLMRLYSKKFGNGIFSYPVDWSGFNIPSKVIYDLYYINIVSDENEYDNFIQLIDQKIQKITRNRNYYLIGSETGMKHTIDHEIAHGFYYLNKDYRNKSNKIVDSIKESSLQKIKKHLLKIGYNEKVFRDEVQAYISNDPEYFIQNAKLNKKETKDLQRAAKQINILFNEYNKRQN